jgi:flagellar assembly protein FliH
VRVNDALLDILRERLDALASGIGFNGRIIAIADPAVAPGDARIEWADGGAERDSARAWADIDAHIARFIETWPQGRQS